MVSELVESATKPGTRRSRRGPTNNQTRRRTRRPTNRALKGNAGTRRAFLELLAILQQP